MTQHDEVHDEMVRRAEQRSQRLNDPCKHLTRCADAACNHRMADAGQSMVAIGQERMAHGRP